jgi:hypothetical protein
METFPYLSAFIKSFNQGHLDFQHRIKADFTISAKDEKGKFYQSFIPIESEEENCVVIGNTFFKSVHKVYI